ncbi:MAG TPA: hypothetical protein VG101_06430 [Puia sp.]|jgi:hypothetical protein|nr:hypothetical protein [Puia sp.]
MIQFIFTGEPFPSLQQQEEAKADFIKKLGPFKEEFDEQDGIVTINYSYSQADTRRWQYNLGKSTNPMELIDFIDRWQRHGGNVNGN